MGNILLFDDSKSLKNTIEKMITEIDNDYQNLEKMYTTDSIKHANSDSVKWLYDIKFLKKRTNYLMKIDKVNSLIEHYSKYSNDIRYVQAK